MNDLMNNMKLILSYNIFDKLDFSCVRSMWLRTSEVYDNYKRGSKSKCVLILDGQACSVHGLDHSKTKIWLA